MYIVYIQQVVKVLKNIYVINYKSNDHPLVNSLFGRIIDRFFFLGLSLCFFVCRVRVCVCVVVIVSLLSVCARECVASSVSDTQNAYLILFASIQFSFCFTLAAFLFFLFFFFFHFST